MLITYILQNIELDNEDLAHNTNFIITIMTRFSYGFNSGNETFHLYVALK